MCGVRFGVSTYSRFCGVSCRLMAATIGQKSDYACVASKRGVADAVNDADLIESDLHRLHELANDFTSGRPIGVIQTFGNLRCERLKSGQALAQLFLFLDLGQAAFLGQE